MTPKQRVLKKRPKAELARDGWHHLAGPSGCYDFAIFIGSWLVAQGTSARAAWRAAATKLRA